AAHRRVRLRAQVQAAAGPAREGATACRGLLRGAPGRRQGLDRSRRDQDGRRVPLEGQPATCARVTSPGDADTPEPADGRREDRGRSSVERTMASSSAFAKGRYGGDGTGGENHRVFTVAGVGEARRLELPLIAPDGHVQSWRQRAMTPW